MTRWPCLVGAIFAIAACAGVEDIGLRATRIDEGLPATPLDSDEKGIWRLMEKAERELILSGQVVRDPDLQAYVEDVMCRVAGSYCVDIRVYVVDQPGFNAATAPNGFVSVWTGLFLRAENEAQLASVLAHEVAHYQRRHSLERWRNARNASGAANIIGVLAAGVGVGGIGALVMLGAMGQVLAFSRDQEREADRIGIDRLAAAGYAPNETVTLWQHVLQERETEDDDGPPLFLATHPAAKERLGTMRALAAELEDSGASREVGVESHARAIADWRGTWIENELQRGWFDKVELILDRLIGQGIGLGELDYYRGELYRRRGEDGDPERAIEEYQAALEHPDAPAEAHRALGMHWRASGERDLSRKAFGRYLALSPAAPDRAMIRAYMNNN